MQNDKWSTIYQPAVSEPAPRVAKSHECPHCYRQTHPEKLTQRQAQMYDSHTFDASYDVSSDESAVVCIGADYEGPMLAKSWMSITPSSGWSTYTYTQYFTPSVWIDITPPVQKTMYTLNGVEKTMKSSLWNWDYDGIPGYSISLGTPYLPVGEPEKLPTDCEKLPIKYNDPDNWKPWEKEWYPVSPGLDIKWEQWHASFPTPDSPGYDFKAFSSPEVEFPKKKRKKK